MVTCNRRVWCVHDGELLGYDAAGDPVYEGPGYADCVLPRGHVEPDCKCQHTRDRDNERRKLRVDNRPNSKRRKSA